MLEFGAGRADFKFVWAIAAIGLHQVVNASKHAMSNRRAPAHERLQARVIEADLRTVRIFFARPH